MPWPGEVARAVERALRRHDHLDYITFSGNGEPTLHPAFGEVAAAVRRLRDRLLPNVGMALFSNASTLSRDDVVAAIPTFDAPMLKLDAGDPKTFAAVDRPAASVEWAAVVAGLKAVRPIQIQTVFLDGRASNTTDDALEAWLRAVRSIQPERVLVYSTDYPVADSGIERVLPYRLASITRQVSLRTGVPAEAEWVRS